MVVRDAREVSVSAVADEGRTDALSRSEPSAAATSAADLSDANDEASVAPLTIDIATSVNSVYALPLLVMLRSLRDRLPVERRVVLHIVHKALPDRVLSALAQIVDLAPYQVDEQTFAARVPILGMPHEAGAPLLLPELMPGHDRVLFLDADLLVLDDITPLWQSELDGRAIGAVLDRPVGTCGARRGVKETDRWPFDPAAPYFNAGILLMDLNAWRERQIAERAADYLREVGTAVDLVQQEALNAVASEDWHPLPERWNLNAATAGRLWDPHAAEHRRNPGIIHFAGRMKPWRMRTGSPFDAAYAETLSRVTDPAPSPQSDLRKQLSDRMATLYDKTVRNLVYPMENALWQRRMF